MASSSSFTLKSYGGDSAAKPLTGCQTKVAQHVVKYGGGGAAYALGGATPPLPPPPGSLQLTTHRQSHFYGKEKGFYCEKSSDVLMYCVGGEENLSHTVYNFPLSSNHKEKIRPSSSSGGKEWWNGWGLRKSLIWCEIYSCVCICDVRVGEKKKKLPPFQAD